MGKETYWLPEEGPCVNAKIIGLGKNLETRGDLHKFKDNWMGKKLTDKEGAGRTYINGKINGVVE